MRAVVKRLRLRLPDRDAAARAQWLIEEAIRLSGRDGGQRLVVIRKLALGRLTSGLNDLVDAKLRELVDRAVPAWQPESATADAVWFETPEAARALLVDQVLRDRAPFAWFWRQAVPDWRPAAPQATLSQVKILMTTPQGRIAFARILLAVLMEGYEERLIQLVTTEAARTLLEIWPGQVAVLQSQASAVFAASTSFLSQPSPVRARLSSLTARHASHDSDLLRCYFTLSVLPAMAPHLASLSGAALMEAVASAPPVSARLQVSKPRKEQSRSSAHLLETKASTFIAPDAPEAVRAGEATRQARAASSGSVAPHFGLVEDRSAAAGLFLLVQPLRFLGFERWLDRHPREAAEGFGWALFRAIAERQRVPDSDPLWQRLWSQPDAPPDTTAWRVAVDRFLRRCCGLTLARVVKRPGWLSGGEGALVVRFPEGAADLRLRRRTFDVDPGFVPWLGIDLAYRYEGRGLP